MQAQINMPLQPIPMGQSQGNIGHSGHALKSDLALRGS